ncbi:hypothetical protein [Pseudomonas bharatica]|uniref:hypothetical protein n=1 Tax=Pseudomonas bharatica TaxID=2692112 RepID=UPI003B287CD1
MSAYQVPLGSVMLLQQVLEKGGTTTCPVRRQQDWDIATIDAEVNQDTASVRVEFKSLARRLRLQRGDSANHLHLRDFIQDLANDRSDAVAKALALMDAHEHLSASLPDGHVAYITPTPWPATPFAAAITNNIGEMCAVASGADKDDLVAKVRAKLGLAVEGNGEQA